MNRIIILFLVIISQTVYSQSIMLKSKNDSSISIASSVVSDSSKKDSIDKTQIKIIKNSDNPQVKKREPHFVTSVASTASGILLASFGIQYWKNHTKYDDAAASNNISPIALGATATISVPVGCILTYFGTLGLISDFTSLFSH